MCNISKIRGTMKRIKKITKYVSIVTFVLFIIVEFLNYLFQGIIYNYYVDKSLTYDVENNFWNIGLQYKRIGVMFSEIGYVIFDIFIIFLVSFIVINIYCFIKKKKNNGELK